MKTNSPIRSRDSRSRRSTGYWLLTTGYSLRYWLLTTGFSSLLLLPGCSDSGPPDHQPAALKDPMNWSPDIEKTDISGGDTFETNREEMGKDLNRALLR